MCILWFNLQLVVGGQYLVEVEELWVTCNIYVFVYPRSTGKGEGVGLCTVLHLFVLLSVCPSVRPKIFFVAFFSATIDGKNLIFSHKLHIGITYLGKRFWTHHIPTSCLRGYHKWALAHSSSCFFCFCFFLIFINFILFLHCVMFLFFWGQFLGCYGV